MEIDLANRIADICQLWEPGQGREEEIWKAVAWVSFLESKISDYARCITENDGREIAESGEGL